MATLTNQLLNRTGVTPTFAAATGGGDACPCSIDTYVEIKNTSATSTTVTFVIPSSKSGFTNAAYANNTVVVPITTGDKIYGPIDPQLHADPVTGLCSITYSQVSGITIGCFTLQEGG